MRSNPGSGGAIAAGLATLLACNDAREDDGFTTIGSQGSQSASQGSDTAATTTGADTGGSTGTTAAGDTTTTADPDSSSSSGGAAVCGNGTIELGEECDDGNDSDLDACTATCTVSRCDDGLLDGAETDLDCGGPCQGCTQCLGCAEPDDCAPGLVCSDGGQCTLRQTMMVDWVAHCGTAADGYTLPDLPAGTYVATPVPSAGTLWLPPFDPPDTGYFYEIQCADGVLLDQLRTPPGLRYGSVASAFANLQADSQSFDFAGGDLTCYRTDDTCADNDGVVVFDVELVCAVR